MPKLLFCSYHSWLDTSSGAALAVRDLLELLAGGGWECRVFTGPWTDSPEEAPIEQLLVDQHLSYEKRRSEAQEPFTLWHYRLGAIAATTYQPDARNGIPPAGRETEPFLALLERLLERVRPDIVLTYGGHDIGRAIIARAKQSGASVVFYLLNFAYRDPAPFRDVDAVLVPSQYSADHYRRTLGLDCTAIPLVINWRRILCEPPREPAYVTFVNPQTVKGVYVFARIAEVLGRSRPDIPLLVVEGREKADRLAQTDVDLRGLTNLHRMANTPDPRDFYRVSRVVLMPSVWNESFGRVAAEAMINGIPVIASNRGALPEVLAEGGILLDLPAHCAPGMRTAPTADEVAPWVGAIERLWDDSALYERERQRCLSARNAWVADRLFVRHDLFLRELITRER